jgi:hypothetical protein
MLYASTGNQQLLTKAQAMVATLGKVQDAWGTVPGMTGYVFPYSIIAFANLEGNPPRNCDPVCVPWYGESSPAVSFKFLTKY